MFIPYIIINFIIIHVHVHVSASIFFCMYIASHSLCGTCQVRADTAACGNTTMSELQCTSKFDLFSWFHWFHITCTHMYIYTQRCGSSGVCDRQQRQAESICGTGGTQNTAFSWQYVSGMWMLFLHYQWSFLLKISHYK